MRIIQPLLLILISCSFVIYLSYLRSVGRDRLVGSLLFLFAFAAVLFPDATTVVANALGVGRGADLVFYLFAALSFFALIMLHLKQKRTEQLLVELARRVAIGQARKM